MTSTQILRVRIVDASAKIRTGAPSDDRADMKNEELRAKTCELFDCENWRCGEIKY
jgi:hypothetical protein